MKKNLVLLLSLIFLAFSYGVKAESKWTPKYQKNGLNSDSKPKIKEIDLQVESKLDTTGLDKEQLSLLKMYQNELKGKIAKDKLRDETLKLTQKAVPVLIKVMKENSFPENNRWLATFMLGRIMGKKSAIFISKFAKHPNWMLRLASLKVLMALNQKQFLGIYGHALKDKALIVRHQALENINKMKLNDLGPNVWGMLYDESNYSGAKGKLKRTNIIKEIILTIGNLDFQKAKKPMLTMIQDKKYKDIFEELDKSLSKLSKLPSPQGNISSKQYFWSRQALKDKTI